MMTRLLGVKGSVMLRPCTSCLLPSLFDYSEIKACGMCGSFAHELRAVVDTIQG